MSASVPQPVHRPFAMPAGARVAFALSQVMVTSGVDVSRNYAMRHYQQTLYDRALGNFYDLLLAVTLFSFDW